MDLNSNKTLFVHIPKTAGGSIKQWLWDNSINFNSDSELLHKSLEETVTFYQKKNISFKYNFSFACIRNTYDRMISVYEWIKYKRNKRVQKIIGRNRVPNREDVLVLEAADKGIVYFFEYLKNNPVDDYSLRSQVEWIKDVDFVLKNENLAQDFKIIQEKLNCYSPLNYQIHKLDYDPSIYYVDGFIKFIKKTFQEELDYFKYLPTH